MGRAAYRNSVQRPNALGVLTPVTATVTVREPGTTTAISETIYDDDGTILANPLTTNAQGEFVIRLDQPKVVDLLVGGSGLTSETIQDVFVDNEPGRFAAVAQASLGNGTLGDVRYVTDSTRGVWISRGSGFYRLSPRINARDFIIADGVTDDGAALNSLIATVSAAGGGVIELPVGTIRTTVAVVQKNKVYLVGQGMGVTILHADFGTADAGQAGVHLDASVSAVTFSGLFNLTIRGNASATTPDYGVFFSGSVTSGDILMDNLEVHDFRHRGIFGQNTGLWKRLQFGLLKIHDTARTAHTATTTGGAFGLPNCEDVTVETLEIYDTGEGTTAHHGIYLSGSRTFDGVVIDKLIVRNSNDAAHIRPSGASTKRNITIREIIYTAARATTGTPIIDIGDDIRNLTIGELNARPGLSQNLVRILGGEGIAIDRINATVGASGQLQNSNGIVFEGSGWKSVQLGKINVRLAAGATGVGPTSAITAEGRDGDMLTIADLMVDEAFRNGIDIRGTVPGNRIRNVVIGHVNVKCTDASARAVALAGIRNLAITGSVLQNGAVAEPVFYYADAVPVSGAISIGNRIVSASTAVASGYSGGKDSLALGELYGTADDTGATSQIFQFGAQRAIAGFPIVDQAQLQTNNIRLRLQDAQSHFGVGLAFTANTDVHGTLGVNAPYLIVMRAGGTHTPTLKHATGTGSQFMMKDSLDYALTDDTKSMTFAFFNGAWREIART